MGKIIQLSGLTTLELGGVPLRYFRPRSRSGLEEALRECRRRRIEWRVLGGGSNLLIDDGPLPYAVIHLCGAGFDAIERAGQSRVVVGAGAATARLLAFCRRSGLGGLEFLAGLPGTVGGAIAGNAGAWGREISGPLVRLWLTDPDGRTLATPAEQVRFSYRRARLGGRVIVRAEFALTPRDPQLIAAQMASHARARSERHPAGAQSAGCIFRNPPGLSAGRLLDLCGLKGVSIGGAQVSLKHANFIVNHGNATTADVLALIARMRRSVRDRFGIELQMEVRRWPAGERVA